MIKTTMLPGIEVTTTAHRDANGAHVLVTLRAEENAARPSGTPLKLAIVIDRSGSMSGRPLETVKQATARFIRSLTPDDQIAVVAYDDEVTLITALQAPSEALARAVEAIEARGSTNLYGGWLLGAKLVGNGGRVILLSDGLANAGRFTHADQLGPHARISYQHFGVTTTTIGVGQGYDEAVMSVMAAEGAGTHYFAQTTDAITEALSAERHSLGQVSVHQVSVRIGGQTEQFGHFWPGEAKRRLFTVSRLAGLPATVRYRLDGSNEVQTLPFDLPEEFGHSDEVTLERILARAELTERAMVAVRDPRSAGEMRRELRAILLELLAHPQADEPSVRAIHDRLNASMLRLEELERNFDAGHASVHRKRSMQAGHNLRERGKAFSSFDDERDSLATMARAYQRKPTHQGPQSPSPEGLREIGVDRWLAWRAMPLDWDGSRVTVAMLNARDGFTLAEIEKGIGRLVQPVALEMDEATLIALLESSR